jgi:hypothetical protein
MPRRTCNRSKSRIRWSGLIIREDKFMKRMKKSKRPVVPRMNRKNETIARGGESYQRGLDVAAQSDVFEAIRQGMDDIAHGRTRPAREVFLSLRRKFGIRR